MNITFPLLLDGAMGTQLVRHGYISGTCPEQWSLEHPDEVLAIQRAYVDAGSQILYAPTFGANSACLEKYGLFNKVKDYNLALVALARQAAADKALVAGDISSIGAMLYPLGDASFEDMVSVYREQAEALEEAGVDLFVIETMTNLAEARAAVLAVKEVSRKPVFVSFSCSENGRTMTGTDVCAALLVMEGMGIDAFGLNCSTGPKEIAAQMRRLSELTVLPLIAKPNAGLPVTQNGKTVYTVSPEEFASFVPALAASGVSLFGACCGSDERFIAALKRALEQVSGARPPFPESEALPCATEREAFLLQPDSAVTVILPCDENLEEALTDIEPEELIGIEIASEEDLATFADCQYAVANPLCLLCEDVSILEKALRCYQGRALYEGSLSEEELLPLAQKYGLIF